MLRFVPVLALLVTASLVAASGSVLAGAQAKPKSAKQDKPAQPAA
ncbi:MAG: hypothetical protein U1E76_01480 [Planctomycetota bacterium]